MSAPLLEVKNLHKHFPIGSTGFRGLPKSYLHAVDGVSFNLHKGETLGLVGESGCGKSTAARAVGGLHPATSGSIKFEGKELVGGTTKDWMPYRRRMQMIFQDPYASLDPRQTVGSILAEPLKIHNMGKPGWRKTRTMELLDAVGLNPRHIHRYPHEFSGGQRQRIGIARAMIIRPKFVVCDEPISALDVSVQAQVINLLDQLKQSLGLTLLFIAHDLSMVRYVSDRMAVMYLGTVVETGPADEVFFNPLHPYTQLLIESNPEPDPDFERARQHQPIRGEITSPINIQPGCRFADRCPKALPVCKHENPPTIEPAANHIVTCHLFS